MYLSGLLAALVRATASNASEPQTDHQAPTYLPQHFESIYVPHIPENSPAEDPTSLEEMPSTDSLQPPLNEAERAICKSYGGWTNFMHSMGLKPWNEDDASEGKAIIAAFASNQEEDDDQDDLPADKAGSSTKGTNKTSGDAGSSTKNDKGEMNSKK